ncbi:MAG: hypothetical protein GXO47_02270 [Chlorobi bacterium]|nr:hypothetical protein [Chlorobiota bacterium]
MSNNDDIFDNLEKIKNNPPFAVPENYFDTFHDRLMKKIKNESDSKQTGIKRFLKPLTGIAASIILATALYFAFFMVHKNIATAENDTILLNEFDKVIEDPVAMQLNEYDLTCYITGCNQTITDFENDDTDYSDLTIEDIDNLILF